MLEFSLSLIKSTWQQWLLCSTTEQKFCFASRIRVNKTKISCGTGTEENGTGTEEKFYLSTSDHFHLFWLTLSRRRSLSYKKNQSINLLWKSMDWFLYDVDLRHERVKWHFEDTLSLHVEFMNHSFSERIEQFLSCVFEVFARNGCFTAGLGADFHVVELDNAIRFSNVPGS